ncbi:MAG: PEP-CTERM sorting domain-containing protein [Candidatus Omnitrophica bacterium]|nr:PEP-CTERM sorting domain-containing protein [Candidatus Omnitrophota bacterium]
MDNIAYNIPGTQTREGMGGTNSYLPVAINDHDLIVGTYFRIGRRSGTTSEWKFDINSSEFAENFSSMDWVEDVNNSGQIAGRGWDGISAYGACYWDNNEIVVIDPDPDDYSYSSMAVGINEKKQIIGLRDYGDFRTAWIWENGEMKELIRLDNERTLNYLSKINDLGQIIGGGTLNGESHAFLLTPAGIIPEPSSLLMFGLGMLGLLSRKNKILRLRR